MEIKGIGVDIVEISRIKKMVQAHRERVKGKVFTEKELAYCYSRNNPYPSLSARFAAKEAVAKALGGGIRGMGWGDIEILQDDQGKPSVVLWRGARDTAGALGIGEILLSLSHSKQYAVAQAIALAVGDKD